MCRCLEVRRRFVAGVGTAAATTITAIVSLVICVSLLVSTADTYPRVDAFIVDQVKIPVHYFSSSDRIRRMGSTTGVVEERVSPSALSLSSSRPSSSPEEDKKKGPSDQTQYRKRRRKESATNAKNKYTNLPVSNQGFPRSEAMGSGDDDTMEKDESSNFQKNKIVNLQKVSKPIAKTDYSKLDSVNKTEIDSKQMNTVEAPQQQSFDRAALSDTSSPDSYIEPTMTTTTTTTTTTSTNTPDLMFTDALLQYSIDSFLSGQYDRPFKEDAPAPLPDLTAVQTVDAALRALREMDVVVSKYGGGTGKNRDEDKYDRELNDDDDTHSISHGAAVLLRFCAPLSRAERWGLSSAGTVVNSDSGMNTEHSDHIGGEIKKQPFDSWKELMRGSLTPHMLAKRIRCSQDFSGLLDWEQLDVSLSSPTTTQQLEKDCDDDRSTGSSNRVDVDSVLYYSDNKSVHDNSQKRTYNRREKAQSTESNAAEFRDVIRFHMVRLNGVWLIESAEKTTSKQ